MNTKTAHQFDNITIAMYQTGLLHDVHPTYIQGSIEYTDPT